MTLTNSKNLASAIDPKVRDYLDAKLREEFLPIRDDLKQLASAISAVREADQQRCDTLSARVTTVHEIIKLSKGRVERLAQLLGDEE